MNRTKNRWFRTVVSALAVLAAGIFTGEPASAQSQTCNTPAYYYLTCGATGYQVNAANRLVQVDQGTYSLIYNVNQSYMTTTGDTCFVVETHTLNTYDSCTKYWSSTTNPLVVPAGHSLGVTGDQFTVKYPALGSYRANLTLHSGHALQIVSQP
ncbi:MAG: hypothetical protein ACOY0T_05580 [Myxococcota bacterium]